MDISVISLKGLRLPESYPIKRQPPVPLKQFPPHFAARFDQRTLAYDCVYLADQGGYLLSCPRFLNIWWLFRLGLWINGRPVLRMRRNRGGHADQVFISGPPGAKVSFVLPRFSAVIPVREGAPETFEGKNVIMAINQNNDLDWIAEWARFHARTHGANGAILFDNGSDAYTLDDLVATFRAVTVLDVVRIVDARFPFGDAFYPPQRRVHFTFLQPSLFNLARRDLAARCRAMLNCDIDEMVLSLAGRSVFDVATSAEAPEGGIYLDGECVWPEERGLVRAAQSLHCLRADPPMTCNGKWCATPDAMGVEDGGWDVHAFGGKHTRAARDAGSRHLEFPFAHCGATTTAWRGGGPRWKRPDRVYKDETWAAQLQRGRAPQ